MPIIMEKFIKNFIENHAKEDKNEIYGWLIGYDDGRNVYINAVIDCQNYMKQNTTSAIPDIVEFQKISSSIPQGIGIVGIYHSHPNMVFHSHVDDITLKNLRALYPNVISIVTNGYKTKYYRFLENNLTSVDIFLKKINPRKKILFESEMIIPSKFKDQNALSSFLRDKIENYWELKKFCLEDLAINKSTSISKLLNKTISIKFSQNFNQNGIKIPLFAILLSSKNKTLEDINELIKFEIINDMLQKISKSTFSNKLNIWIVPSPLYLNYMGIPLKFYLKSDQSIPKYLGILINEMNIRINRLKKIKENKFADLLEKSINKL